jgi:hypothetical protein
MKRALRWTLLLGVLAFAWNLFDSGPALMLGVPQSSAPRLPDAPPPGPPMPGEPIEIRPRRPDFPPDFQEGPKEPKTQRKMVDPVQTQKDAEELAALSKKVQGEVGQLSKNLLSKDLDKELKQIQKLAKRLRGEITP